MSPAPQGIRAWLVARIAALVGLPEARIDVRQPLAHYGLSSSEAVSLAGDLQDWIGRTVSATLAWEYPTIEAIAAFLGTGTERPGSGPAADGPRQRGLEPIAIVGIGCRFPSALNARELWQLLLRGGDAISAVPPDRWDLERYYDPDPAVPGRMNTRWGGFLPDVDRFDAAFFGIAPREAERIDPQQRLLLEVVWEAFEDAGIPAEELTGSRTGVFVGASNSDYGRMQLADPSLVDAYTGTGNALSVLANRISFVLDLRGPSLAVDTACSSSLVAVHLACQSLWCGESSLALAGGANLVLSPEITINFSKARAMAPDGRCRAFDAQAAGYVRSEGIAVVVLKPLAASLADRDRIYAVIRGSAVNQDGRSNGLMAPNRQSQEAVLREAYRCANISPGRVCYVEAHGTGTLLGDPIEARALGRVLSADRTPGDYCLIGSVKTNIGHAEAAAGVAGLIKVALALHHRLIPPSIHFHTPNPHIPFDDLPIRVAAETTALSSQTGPCVAGVSSFGFGGTNAHVVLEEGPRLSPAPALAAGSAELVPLSARSGESLRSLAAAYRDALRVPTGLAAEPFENICYTAAVRRSHHDNRLAVVARSSEQFAQKLDDFLRAPSVSTDPASRRRPSGERPKLVLVFPGEGSPPQRPGMGRVLLEREPVFQAAIARCNEALRPFVNSSIDLDTQSNDVHVVQRTLFALQVALAALWRSWGIEPDAVVGHGMGEVAAAHVAGSLTLEEAARLICLRKRGAMAVDAGEVKGRPPKVRLYSNLRDEVLFRDTVCRLLDDGHDAFLEMSPHPALLPAIADIIRDTGRAGLALPSLRRDADAHDVLLESLGALYVGGFTVDWKRFHASERRLVTLPTYPWQRERLWLDAAQPTAPAPAADRADPPLLYTVQWRQEDVATSEGTRAGDYLLFADRSGIGEALAAELTARGKRATVIFPPEGAAFGPLLRNGITDVVFLGALDEIAPAHNPTGARHGGWRTVYGAALHLVKAMAATGSRDPPRLWLVTSGTQRVDATGDVDSSTAPALWGMAAVMAHDHPQSRCTIIDLPAEIDGAGSCRENARALVEELVRGGREDRVALRGGRRYVARLIQRRQDPAGKARRPLDASPIRSDGSYVIAGKPTGRVIALLRWLVDRGAKYVVLASPIRPHPEARRAVEELRVPGVEVRLAEVDPSRAEDLATLLAELMGEAPPLRGIIYAIDDAPDQSTLQELEVEELVARTASVVDGAWNLHALTPAAPLDFFVLFSSALSLLGSPGQASRAAAAACLDTLAHHRASRGLPALSINWGRWGDDGAAEPTEQRAMSGLENIPLDQALGLLDKLVPAAEPQLVAMLWNARRWRESYPLAADSSLIGELAPIPPIGQSSGHMRSVLLAEPPPERRAKLEAYLQEQVAHVLRVPPTRVDRNAPLGRLGIDSLMALEIRNRLEIGLGLTLSATLVWTYPTVAAIAEFLACRMGIELERGGQASTTDKDMRDILTAADRLSPGDVHSAIPRTEGHQPEKVS